mgnify:CR=1 FL=1
MEEKRSYNSKTVRLSNQFLEQLGNEATEGESLEATLRRLLNWNVVGNGIVNKYVTESSGEVLPFSRYEDLVLASSVKKTKDFWTGYGDNFALIGMWLEIKNTFKEYPAENQKLKNGQSRWKARVKNAIRRLIEQSCISLDRSTDRGDWQYFLTEMGERKLQLSRKTGWADKKINIYGFEAFVGNLKIELSKGRNIEEAYSILKEDYVEPYD